MLITAAGAAGFWLGRKRGWRGRDPVAAAAVPATPPGAEPLALVTVISGLAHELRNPLSNLKLNLQLLREDLATLLAEQADDPPQRRILSRFETAVGEAGRLERTLEQFLQFASNPNLQLRRADVNGVVAELLDFFTPQAAAHRVCVRALPAGQACLVRLDPGMFKQALLNLLINAQQAVGDGGEVIVRVEDPAEQRVRIVVTDTGPGMPPEQIDRIFQAYYSTKKGGTGLGLPISRKIIHAHGGTLTCCSDVGKGTEFRIELPLAGAGPADSPDRIEE